MNISIRPRTFVYHIGYWWSNYIVFDTDNVRCPVCRTQMTSIEMIPDLGGANFKVTLGDHYPWRHIKCDTIIIMQKVNHDF